MFSFDAFSYSTTVDRLNKMCLEYHRFPIPWWNTMNCGAHCWLLLPRMPSEWPLPENGESSSIIIIVISRAGTTDISQEVGSHDKIWEWRARLFENFLSRKKDCRGNRVSTDEFVSILIISMTGLVSENFYPCSTEPKIKIKKRLREIVERAGVLKT